MRVVFRDKQYTYNVIVFRVCLTIVSMVSKSVFSLYFWSKYAAVNNRDIESVATKRKKCITFSVIVEIKNVS
jgi:hypothetical protein